LVVDLLLFLLGTTFSVAASVQWAWRFRRDGLAAMLCAAIVLWTGLIVGSQLLLSAAGLMRPTAVHATVAAISSLLFFWLLRRPDPELEEPERPDPLPEDDGQPAGTLASMSTARPAAPPVADRMEWIVALMAIVLIAVPIAKSILKEVARTPWDGDSLLYHLPMLLDSYLEGHIWSLAGPYSHYPPYGELSGGWWWSSHWHDALIWLQNSGAYLLFAAALVRLMSFMRVRSVVAWFVVGLFLKTSPALRRQFGDQETDLWMAAFLLAGLVWSLGRLRTRRERWMAGVALGLAAGAKYHAPVFIGIVLGIAFLARWGRENRWSRGKVLLAVAAVALAVGSVPYLRNWIVTGNPLYPAKVAVFNIVLFERAAHGPSFGGDQFTSIWPFLRDSSNARLHYLRGVIRHLGFLPLIGLGLVPVALRLRRQRGLILSLFLGSLAMFAVTAQLPGFPRKALGETPDWLIHGYSMIRYAIVPFGLQVVPLAAVLDTIFSRMARRTSGIVEGVEGSGSNDKTADRWISERLGAWVARIWRGEPWDGRVAWTRSIGFSSHKTLRTWRAASLLTGLFISLFCAAAILSPGWSRARERSRPARLMEISRLEEDITVPWKELNRRLRHRDVLVWGTYPWFFAGEDFSNYLRIPDTSYVPIDAQHTKNRPVVLVRRDTPGGEPTPPWMLNALGFSSDHPPTLRFGPFQIWEK